MGCIMNDFLLKNDQLSFLPSCLDEQKVKANHNYGTAKKTVNQQIFLGALIKTYKGIQLSDRPLALPSLSDSFPSTEGNLIDN